MRLRQSIVLILLGNIIFFGCLASGAGAEEAQHSWGIGIRGGFSSFAKEISNVNELEGETGGVFNGLAIYELTDSLSFGLEVEWDQHAISKGTLSYGKVASLSLLLPFEFHMAKTEKVSPYCMLACGYTFNQFKESQSFKDAYGPRAYIELDNAYMVKSGLGIDMFFLSETVAINLEAGMSYSIGGMHIVGDTVDGRDDYNRSVLFLVMGFRYYLPDSSFP